MAGVYNADGVLFAGYQRGQKTLPERISILPSNGSIVHVTAPVIRSGIRIGTIYLASTIDPLSRRLNRSEEHTSELQSLMRISYAVFCLTTKTHQPTHKTKTHPQNKLTTNPLPPHHSP